MNAQSSSDAYNALVLAPRGRDAAVAVALLAETGIAGETCHDLDHLCDLLGDDIAFCVITEEAAHSADLRGLIAWHAAQPAWSDMPFIVLTGHGSSPDSNPSALRLFEAINNVTFLERPFRSATFVSMARAALKARRRQYDARVRLLELREGEQRLQMALTAGRLGSWELDLATGTLVASETCKANFGRPVDQPFTYDELLAAVHPEDRQRVNEAVDLSIGTGNDYAIEHRVVWPDGSLHWLEVRARVVKGTSGNAVCLIGVSSDITLRKASEENLRSANTTLEEHVRERTRELEQAHALVLKQIQERARAEEQLRQAQKMEAVGKLTGGVAHDFNNLLMAVIANLELLRKRAPSDPKLQRLVDSARQGAERGAALTQRLLAFARRQELKVQPTDLIRLVRGMTDLLTRSTGPAIEMELDLPEALPPAIADGNQVELALLNLVVNARDAMPDGGTLVIKLDAVDLVAGNELAPGRYLRLSVADTGFGMDAETLKRAIDPFFSTKELGKGTGLGLSMVHGLAVQLNGALRLESAPGCGTTAELWLPVAQECCLPESAPARNSGPVPNAAPATILVVDDDVLVAMSTADMLADLGHEVIEANSGAGALAILQEGQPVDLLITDYAMPGMTGLDLVKAVRIMRPTLPILMSTGYAELPAGAELELPRISKPYQQDQLAECLATLLGARANLLALGQSSPVHTP